MKKLVFINIFIALFALQNTATAQNFSSILLPEINITIIPENPEPNSTVYVSINSFETNLDSADIEWFVNDKKIKGGVAEKSIQFEVGGITSTSVVSAVIKTINGDLVEKSISVRPSVVDMYWQSDSSVPPFYKGKALFAHQNVITVVALPQITNSSGVLLDPRVLTYKWKKNGSVQENQSGYGKNTYSFTSPLISRDLSVSVEVTAPSTATVGMGQINLFPIEPEVLFYEKKPLLGVEFQKALVGNLNMNNQEITLVSYPYYFDNKFIFGQLVYKWSVNGSYLPESIPSQVFRIPDGVSGKSSVVLSVENTNKILQTAKAGLGLVFEQDSNPKTVGF